MRPVPASGSELGTSVSAIAPGSNRAAPVRSTNYSASATPTYSDVPPAAGYELRTRWGDSTTTARC